MPDTPLVIGYDIERALQLLNNEKSIVIKNTMTIFEDKVSARKANIPIVVRQKTTEDTIELTTSLFE